MTTQAKHTYQEIISQPNAWAQALEVVQSQKGEITQLWNDRPNSLAAASLFQELTGRGARAIPGGELILYPDSAYEADMPTLLVAISRSGTTTETVAAAQKFKNADRGPVLVITNYGNTPLAQLGDISIIIPAGQEETISPTG